MQIIYSTTFGHTAHGHLGQDAAWPVDAAILQALCDKKYIAQPHASRPVGIACAEDQPGDPTVELFHCATFAGGPLPFIIGDALLNKPLWLQSGMTFQEHCIKVTQYIHGRTLSQAYLHMSCIAFAQIKEIMQTLTGLTVEFIGRARIINQAERLLKSGYLDFEVPAVEHALWTDGYCLEDLRVGAPQPQFLLVNTTDSIFNRPGFYADYPGCTFCVEDSGRIDRILSDFPFTDTSQMLAFETGVKAFLRAFWLTIASPNLPVITLG